MVFSFSFHYDEMTADMEVGNTGRSIKLPKEAGAFCDKLRAHCAKNSRLSESPKSG